MKKPHSRTILVLVLLGLLAGMVLPALPAPLAPEEAVAQGEVTYPPFEPDSAITHMKVVALEDDPDSNPCGGGWKWIDVDLNKWAGGDWVYFCYQEGSPSDAITDIKFILNTTNCGAGYTRDSTDLNEDAGGDDIYLCYRRGGALPIIKLDVVTGITSLVACPRFDGEHWTKNPTDLNSDAGGLYVYLCYVDLAGTAGIDNCGNEGEGPCTILTTFFWENGSGVCDRGLRQAGDECINGLGDHARYNKGDEVLAFQDSWALWALQNQRKDLAWNEPLTSVMHIGAHNAYNNTADGYIFPNQTYSITDMLRTGVRLIELDVHSGDSIVTGTYPQLCHAGGAGGHTGCVVGDRDFYNAIKEIRHWMTRPENEDEVVLLFLEGYVADEDDDYVAGVLDLYLGGPDIGLYTRDDWVTDGSDSLPSQSELVARGKRAIPYTNQKEIEPFLREGDITNGASFVTTIVDDLDTTNCQVDGAAVDDEFPDFRRVYDNRVDLFGGDVRRVTPDEMADFVNCNVTLIDIDDILDYDDDETRGDRLKSAIWSWADGERGQPGEAAFVDDDDNRWYSDAPDVEHHYVCFDATRNDFSVTPSFGFVGWLVTDAAGPFDDGIAACEAEFPGSTFNVPRNGYENTVLSEVLDDADGPAWLNYHDTNEDGRWGSLPDGFIIGSTKAIEGEIIEYTTGLDFEAEVIDATCGDGAPPEVDLASDIIGETLSANQELQFQCLFPDGPMTSTISVTFDDPNAEAHIVEQKTVRVSNAQPSIIQLNDPIETILEGTDFTRNLFFVLDAGGVDIPDGAGSEDLSGTIDWGDGTSESVRFGISWLYDVGGVGYGTRAIPSRTQHAWDIPGSYNVMLTVCDKDSKVSDCTPQKLYTAEVLHVTASIDSMPAPTSLNEGSVYSGTAEISVPDNDDIYTLAVSYGDGSVSPPIEVTSEDTSVELNHTYADDGAYLIEINICDDEGGCAGSDTTTVTVNNVQPELTPADDFTVAEGESFTQELASFTDPGFDCLAPGCDPETLEDFEAEIDWDDTTTSSGAVNETPGEPGTATTGTVSGTHAYADNGTYTVSVGVRDDDDLIAPPPASLKITVENVAPSVATPVVASSPSGEGEEVTLTASFSDPAGIDDGPFTCQISWGDGTTTEGALDGMSCAGGHTYADDSPSAGHPVTVTVADKDGGSGSSSVVQTVNNVAPTLSNLSPPAIDETGTATLSGDISDPGVYDNFSLVIDWGDGSAAETFTYPAGTTSFSESHQYLDDNPSGTASDSYTVSLTLTDKDAGSTTATVKQTVNNVAPTIAGISVPAISEHYAPVPVSVTASDVAGSSDPLTYAFDCDGDGVFEQDTGASNSATCIIDPTTFSPDIGVRVSDDDLGITTQTVTLAVEKHLCQHQGSGKLSGWNAEDGCSGPHHEIVISGAAPLNLCLNTGAGQLRAHDSCSDDWDSYTAPGSTALQLCRSEKKGDLRLPGTGKGCKSKEVADLIPAV